MSENEAKVETSTVTNEETTNPVTEDKNEQENTNIQSEQTSVKEEDKKDISPADKTIENAKNLVEEKGLNYNDLVKEYTSTGALSQETREKLIKSGISEETIDSYIEGQEARKKEIMTDIVNSVGGDEQYQSIVNWANTNLTPEIKAEINEEHNPTRIKLLLEGLRYRMEKTEGKNPQQLQGSGATTSSNDLFESMAEMQDAINDPRYARDEVYREKVSKKITASKQAGKIRL